MTERQLDGADVVPGFDAGFEPESLAAGDVDDADDDDSLDDESDFGALSEPPDDSDELPDGVVELEPRLSVLKNPEPLKVTPTGWKTFFTASTSPDSGCVYSVSVSSVNACWTSMVSPDSTNL